MKELNGEIVLECAIFKMKKTLTGFKWKKKWIRTDGVKLYQWATDVKPGTRTKPKHVYQLSECSVRDITANKPHAFCVHDNSKNEMMVFAAKNRKEMDQWVEVLSRQSESLAPFEISSGPEDEVGETNEMLDCVPEDLSIRELATMYFEEYDINSHLSNNAKVAIDEKLFPDLMAYIGIKLSQSDLFFSLQSVKNENETIHLKDFLLWLNQHPELTSGNGEYEIDADGIDEGISRFDKPSKKALSFECDELLRLNHSGSTWLNMLEPAHIAGILDTKRVDLVKCSSLVTEMQHNMPIISDVVKTWPFEEVTDDWDSCYQKLLEEVTDGEIDSNKIEPGDFSQLYELCAVQSHFLKTAIAGCTVIVDEFSLPTSLKSSTVLSVSEASDDSENVKEAEEEVYFLNNLVFRLLGNSSTDKDQKPSLSRLLYITSTDEIVRKIAGNDHRSHEAVRKALINISNDNCSKGLPPLNSSVLLTATIDYCGYRLQVFSPLAVDEVTTLVYGNATSENIFVNALSDIDYEVIPSISHSLNLSLSGKDQLTSMEKLSGRNPSAAKIVNCESLSKDLQIHHCGKENRFYLFNFNNFFPPDLPRPDSNDIKTRHLRPEYVENYSRGSIDSQAVSNDNMSILTQDRQRSRSVSSPVHEDSVRQSFLGENPLQAWVRAASHLHSKVIPNVAHELDTMSVLPLDSFGLTEYLHSHGVNIRYIGKIYKMSKAPHVKDLLLCEAVARCVKSLLNQSLRNIARKGRAETIIAEDRKRSQKGDFINHQSKILTSKTAVVIYFFNLVLGFGESTDSFWEYTLPKLLLSKYELEMPKRDKKVLFFFPQLIRALEYHTNVYFSHEKSYNYASPRQPEPFTEDDLKNYDCNFKFQLCISGIFHRCEHLAEAFLASNMLPQAIAAFKIRLSTQNIFMRGMSKRNTKVAHQVHLTTYKLALCYYLQNSFELCSSLLESLVERVRKKSPFYGRIIALMMCADFKRGDVARAMELFEVARLTCLHSLGPRHPIIALLYTSMADLYFMSKAYAHAKLLVYKAVDFTQRTLGIKHLANAGYCYKLGAIMLREDLNVDAMEMFHEALTCYSQCAMNGAEFGHEIAVCYHGLAIASAQLGDGSAAIKYCKKSLAITTADEKYITAHAVKTIILLAEEHEKQHNLQETLNLYSDAWAIVQAYSKDFDLPKILVIIAARIFSTFVNKQPMHIRMLFHTTAAECEAQDPSQTALDSCSTFLSQELNRLSPVEYIDALLKSLSEGTDNVLNSHSRHLLGTQKSIFGVPCPDLKISEHLDEEVTNDDNSMPNSTPPGSVVPDDDVDGENRTNCNDDNQSSAVPPSDLQALTVLRMILKLSDATD